MSHLLVPKSQKSWGKTDGQKSDLVIWKIYRNFVIYGITFLPTCFEVTKQSSSKNWSVFFAASFDTTSTTGCGGLLQKNKAINKDEYYYLPACISKFSYVQKLTFWQVYMWKQTILTCYVDYNQYQCLIVVGIWAISTNMGPDHLYTSKLTQSTSPKVLLPMGWGGGSLLLKHVHQLW